MIRTRRSLSIRKIVAALVSHRLTATLLVGGANRRRLTLLAWSTRTRMARGNILNESLWLSNRLMAHGHLSEARTVCRVTERALVPGSVGRLRMGLRRAMIDLSDERVPQHAEQLLADGLEAADERFEAGDYRGTAQLLSDVFVVAFHRATHFEDHPSPLAADPDAFLAPFRASSAFAALTSQSGRARPPALAEPARKLLFVSRTNWNFVREIVEDYRQTDGVEVRTLDVKDLPAGPWAASPVELIRRRLAESRGEGSVDPPPGVLEPFLWADVVFVEWGHRALAWTSLLPGFGARLVTRIHSYEVLTEWPFVTNWGAVDDVIFVAPAIRALAESSIPGLVSGPRRHTIANRNLLDRFHRPKRADSERTVALLGWNSATKDPAWALDVLSHLNVHDDGWRLLLIGHRFPTAGLTRSGERYRDALHRRIASMGSAVELVPFTDDVPGVLTRVGVILSASRREGTHEGLIQGAASGALPVVRDWPHLANWGGPRALFPSNWVVRTPAEAANRILTVKQSPDAKRQVEECRQYVREHFDYAHVRPHLDEVILGPRSARG